MNIVFIYHQFFTLNGKEMTIGGIQTYIQKLSEVFSKAGHTCTVVQLSDSEDWTIEKEFFTVKAFAPPSNIPTRVKQSRYLISQIFPTSQDHSDSLLIWGSDNLAIKHSGIKSIAIQHGIGFDGIWLDSSAARILHKLNLQILHKFQQRWKSVSSFLKSDIKVCVDYNYLNWIRTMVPRHWLTQVHVIPNFTETSELPALPRAGSELRVLFARRFTEERGSKLMVDIVKTLLTKHSDIHFTIAGSGPYKGLFDKEFTNNSRVEITKFQHFESLEIHSKHHIALVPTCWSEGTSLSLLEAMTAGCVPIVSNVGGMTNIVLDHFNGRIIPPEADQFVEAISELYYDEHKRTQLQANAKASADQSFSREKWGEKWLKVIESV